MAEQETPETPEEETEQPETPAEETEEQPTGTAEEETEAEESDDDAKSKPKTAEQLRQELRRSDRVRKREAAKKDRELADLRERLKKREEADQTEQEKAVEKAKEEGRASALSEVQKELRTERLAGAVTRLAAKGIKVGEGDDAETVKFADRPTRVMLEQALANEDVDSADVFDDKGRVREDGLRDAVAALLADEENLIVRPPSNGETKKPPANDAGRGGGSGSKTLDEMTPDEHLAQVQRR